MPPISTGGCPSLAAELTLERPKAPQIAGRALTAPAGGAFGLLDDHHHTRVPHDLIVEANLRVDIWPLLQCGGLAENAETRLQWGDREYLLAKRGLDILVDGTRVAIIWDEPMPGVGRPWFECRATRTAGNLNLDGQLIPIRSHPHLPMPVFGCPRCGTDRYRLHEAAGVWACRECHGLEYACRHTHRLIPGLNRLLYLRRRIGAAQRPFSPIAPRPKSHVRYHRVVAQIRALEARLLGHLRADVNDVIERRIERRGE
jgi:hypothetical protein